jgi:hypothetical protein
MDLMFGECMTAPQLKASSIPRYLGSESPLCPFPCLDVEAYDEDHFSGRQAISYFWTAQLQVHLIKMLKRTHTSFTRSTSRIRARDDEAFVFFQVVAIYSFARRYTYVRRILDEAVQEQGLSRVSSAEPCLDTAYSEASADGGVWGSPCLTRSLPSYRL